MNEAITETTISEASITADVQGLDSSLDFLQGNIVSIDENRIIKRFNQHFLQTFNNLFNSLAPFKLEETFFQPVHGPVNHSNGDFTAFIGNNLFTVSCTPDPQNEGCTIYHFIAKQNNDIHKMLREIYTESNHAVSCIDNEGMVVFTNQPYLQLLEANHSDVVGTRFCKFHYEGKQKTRSARINPYQYFYTGAGYLKTGKKGVIKKVIHQTQSITSETGETLHYCHSSEINDEGINSHDIIFQIERSLSGIKDQKTLFKTLGDLILPEIADWFSIDQYDENIRTIRSNYCCHSNRALNNEIRKALNEVDIFADDRSPVKKTILTGKPELQVFSDDMDLINASSTSAQLRFLRLIDAGSILSIPLKVKGKVTGAITLVYSSSNTRKYSLKDARNLNDLISRISIVMENIRLFEQSLRELETKRVIEAKMDSMLLEINAEREKFSSIINTIPGIVWETSVNLRDQHLSFNFISEYIFKMLGYTPEEMMKYGSGILHLIHKDDHEEVIGKISQISGTSPEGTITCRFLKKTGDVVWLESHYCCYEADDIQIIRGVSMDVTEMKIYEQKKDDFVSIASHELKTPLTSLKAYIQLLEKHYDGDSRARQYLKKTNTYIFRLNNLISDLLDVSKIQSGKIQYNMVKFSFDDLLNECIESTQHYSPSYRLVLKGGVNRLVIGDKHRLEQVLMNLLNNAIKYSPDADLVEINASAKDDMLTVAITDYGIGISKEAQASLFSRFHRVEKESCKFPGLGLGLYICKEIINRHNGTITVNSSPGIGSTFIFNLPILSQLNLSLK